MKNTIGIIGGGQLGRMLGIAAKRLGFTVIVIDPTPNSPAGQVVDEQVLASFTDTKAIKALAKRVTFLTFEIEQADAHVLEKLQQQGIPINPDPKTLAMIKDKYKQKLFLQELHIPVASSIAVTNQKDIELLAKKWGYPLLLKARTDAYDGRGNAVIKQHSDINAAMNQLAGRDLYVEQWVPFVKELAVMAARDMHGNVKLYPVVETVHKHNICHVVYAPAQVSSAVTKKAEALARKVMKHLVGAGVFGIEMFLTANEKVIINEIAPRVHNSGHYSLEACVTDQFEQHIRSITGLPLGSTAMLVPAAVMINILGDTIQTATIAGLDKALAIPNVAVHFYGKAYTKIERKMGHLTAIGQNMNQTYTVARRARKLLSI